MQRRKFIQSIGLMVGTVAISKNSLASWLNDNYKIKMLTDDTGIFTERGGTILFQLNRSGLIIVDAQFPETARHLADELKRRSNYPFRLLINTHHHRDHTSGNIVFKGLVKKVIAHQNSKFNQEKSARAANSEAEQLYPDTIFSDSHCEKIGKERVCLHYFGPGHTNGDAVVHFKKARVVHLGDLMFNRRHPNIDKMAGADIGNWIKSLDIIPTKFPDDTLYIAGHDAEGSGVIVDREDIGLFRNYLQNLLKFVQAEIDNGKTRDEILAAKAIPGSPEWNQGDIVKPLSAAYAELTRHYK